MRIDDVVGERCADGWRLSAAVHSAFAADGERLHFTVRGAAPQWLPVLGDAFLAALLMPAMAVGEELVVDAPVSPRLRRSARTVMDVYRAWWGEHYDSISLTCPTTRSSAGGDAAATALYFTAGVDSFYSLLKDVELSDDPAHESVTHLLYANFEAHEGVAYDRLLDRLRRVAGETDRQLVVIETNVRTLADRVAYWPHYHGAALASVALALQGLLGRCLIAASDAYWDLPPWGSHPILDHLWSTESLDVVHDGAEASRTDKVVRQIARSRLALDTLDVCWRSEPAPNCGVCEKCLRTMTTLELADSLSACATLPHTLDLDVLRNARLAAEGQRDAMRCLATDAANRGRTDIVDAIEDCLRRNHPCGGWSEDLASDNPRGCTVQASTTDGDVRAFGAPIP